MHGRTGWLGLAGLLTVALVVLRLTGVLAWSWWWVLSPLWVPVALVPVVLAGGTALAFVTGLATGHRGRRR